MKLKILSPLRYRTKIIRQFGEAKLVRLPNGQHQSIGGTNQDRAAAFERASLLAHEFIFTPFHREEPEPQSIGLQGFNRPERLCIEEGIGRRNVSVADEGGTFIRAKDILASPN